MKKISILLIIALSSCSKVPLTSSIQSELDELGIQPHQMQYYLSSKVLLQRKSVATNKELDQGNIEVRNLVSRDRIVFNSYPLFSLPGVCHGCADNTYPVQFEEGNSNLRSLPFTWNLMRDKFTLDMTIGKTIEYDGSVYSVIFGSDSFLKIKKSAFTKYKRSKRRARGVRITD